VAYVEWRHASVIASLRPHDRQPGRWVLSGLHGPKNEPPQPEAAKTMRGKLASAGVILPVRDETDQERRAVARLFGVYLSRYPDDLDDYDDDAEAADI
jgi:hypothetical protein